MKPTLVNPEHKTIKQNVFLLNFNGDWILYYPAPYVSCNGCVRHVFALCNGCREVCDRYYPINQYKEDSNGERRFDQEDLG